MEENWFERRTGLVSPSRFLPSVHRLVVVVFSHLLLPLLPSLFPVSVPAHTLSLSHTHRSGIAVTGDACL